MSKDKRGLGEAEFARSVKTSTFKQFQQEQLIKAKVLPASKLADTAKRNAEQLREFEAAAEDEKRYRNSAKTAPKDKLGNQPLTRERFEE